MLSHFRALKLYIPTMPLRRRHSCLTVAAGWLLSLLALASRGSIAWLSHALGAPPAPPQHHRRHCSSPGVPAFMAQFPTKGLSTSSYLDRYRLRRGQGTAPMETCWRGSRERLRTVMHARAGEGGWSGTPRNKRPLVFLAEAVNAAVLEMCVENKGRPLAMGMTDLVEHAIEAFASGKPPTAALHLPVVCLVCTLVNTSTCGGCHVAFTTSVAGHRRWYSSITYNYSSVLTPPGINSSSLFSAVAFCCSICVW